MREPEPEPESKPESEQEPDVDTPAKSKFYCFILCFGRVSSDLRDSELCSVLIV